MIIPIILIMGFDLSHAFDRMGSWLCSSKIVNAVISNPIFTALLITALAVVIIMGVYHYCLRKSGWKRIARLSIYLLLVVSAVVFVHHYAVLNRMKTESIMQNSRDVFQSLGAVQGSAEHPVAPPTSAILGGDDGDVAEDCGCTGAPTAVGAASARPNSAPPVPTVTRPDNVQLGEDGITISDIQVPSTKSPLQTRT